MHDFAFRDRGRRRGENVERPQRADLDHHSKSLPEEEVADQNAGFVAPEHPGRQLAAPQFAFIDHIVVQQRGGMHELDGGGEFDVAVSGITRQTGHRQRQHGAQPFSA